MDEQVQEPLSDQVFINFRGDELREIFVNHLELQLRNAGINVFIDTKEQKGRRLQYLFTRIKKSKIALAIFSKRYCESKWCLDELVTMNEQMKEKKLVVIPIFYNVRSDDVKRAANPDGEGNLDGEFSLPFKQLKQNHAGEPERVEGWERALRSVTKRIGFSRSNSKYKHDTDFVLDIVKEVKKQLNIPTDNSWSAIGVAFLAITINLIFSFFIAPKYLPDQKFFQTPEWFIGTLAVVLASWFWYKNNQNKAPPPS
ncbi:unnamed protein product [Arabidopsis thaliana]|jgi:hypothetical protein|uniref:TIR domain-containing protein n=4 Tax=Arabidopsis TaxID=3701 RepID=TIK_ARATH|nr:Toll-Interleukin-Resistance (TIR) domain family protein [Arabidopsis thaliana]Q0WSX8.1 RecName: Full=TIR domain-containing protein; AltName: Full=AtTIK; AltName: Full=TIR-KASH protein [Arabidopsis thaliana]KAG7604961.1 Toll/interleukin-1 receptor homology (TIR) domain superfamily [Arabidopsis thaliana x Arabidopsis arenosa]KAG7612118.1 Toll/interleukin-1 receptor homology (TIR) domain superfamily [Arabidopsis suecica]AED95174.1 Toll-Interleukin-Resistance (TIR) domain family protein [Arabido|eukprot:NP_851131.1 Toll-Interleukin-Resistance (TIR) domain family protein [Arabidopsis thaliana]